VCAYDTDIYRVLTLKIKITFLLMYAYLCNISMVRNVGTRLYNLTKTQFMSETFHFSLHSFVRYSLFLVEGQL